LSPEKSRAFKSATGHGDLISEIVSMARDEAASRNAIAKLPSRQQVTVRGSRLAYTEMGSGEPVLLLHGYPANGLCWRHQIIALSKNYRVIAPDWFGFGESERRFDTNPVYDYEVERIGWMMDALGLDQANIAGHDYGGYLSLAFAARHPYRVTRLAILNCRAHRTFPQPTYAQFAILCAAARTPILRTLLGLVPFYTANKLLLGHYAKAGGPMSEGMLESYIGWMKLLEGRRWLAHFFRYYEMPENKTLAAQLADIRCPTQILWGDRDPYCPYEIAEELADAIQGSTLVRLKGADHFIAEERPEDVNHELAALLQIPARLTQSP
jgi:cis-3-alkyl-4-acyloxetan-2-one decarboxylase